MASRNTALPRFPNPPAQYDQKYFTDFLRAFATYQQQVSNPGEGRATSMVMTNTPTAPTNLEDGTMWNNGGFVMLTPATGSYSFSGDISMSGALSVGTTLSVTGATTLASLSATNGTISGTLGVTGATTLQATSTAALTAASASVSGQTNSASYALGGVALTPTATEYNHLSGVTSPIQTQLNAKAPTASPTFTGTVTAPILNSPDATLTGGTINNMPVGATTASTVRGTTITATTEVRSASYKDASGGNTALINGIAPIALGEALQRSTVLPSTSGLTVEFNGVIPAWAKRITVTLNGVSLSGTSGVQVQVGTSGGYRTTGYQSGSADDAGGSTSTTGLLIEQVGFAAATLRYGSVTLVNHGGTVWVSTGLLYMPGSGVIACFSSGVIDALGAIDRIRLIALNGTDTFDAGGVNVLWD